MESLEMVWFDLEYSLNDEDEESIRFSEVDEGSCYSQFYSTADASIDGCNFDAEIDEVLDSRRVPSVVGSDFSFDIENGVHEFLDAMERDCRICHLSLDLESGSAIELGCSCKNDLAAAHQHCAEAWFKIRGNKVCEICNSFARNVVCPNDIESTQQTREIPIDIESTQQIQIREINTFSTNANSGPAPSTSETRTFLIGTRLVNILLPCIVSFFFLSWLFHFHIPLPFRQ